MFWACKEWEDTIAKREGSEKEFEAIAHPQILSFGTLLRKGGKARVSYFRIPMHWYARNNF
jgi:hypothetical protein